ncbi:MAG: sodium-translocating pyrophosphatase [Candidatus Omnitrophica bacterium]|nr:sodium-translocating pyrophosphatase [Candidatus Omnitrophota bacterium]
MGLVALAPIGSLIAIAYVVYLWIFIMKKDEGTEKMKEIAQAVREGAGAYLKQQYVVVAIYFAVVFVLLFVLYFMNYLPIFTPFAFLLGGTMSGICGFLGMKIATQANSRTARACMDSLNSGLNVSFKSGAVMGLTVVGLGLLEISIGFFFLNWFYSNVEVIADLSQKMTKITQIMLTFGMGASSQALFARLGGGIFTKAADVGADLVGKVEAGIPEDDPRNPATIADNVGDNVGDVAGMGADLYESYVGSIIATMALGVAAFAARGLALEAITIPLTIAACGVVASIIGTLLVKCGEDATQAVLLKALRKGIYTSAALIVLASFFIVKFTFGMEYIGVFWAIIVGLLAGVAIGFFTEYYTSDDYSPTKKLADQAKTGPATFVIAGIALGMLSTGMPVIIISIAILLAYYLAGGGADFNMGLYGVGISAVGMLSTLGITLATDAYGPVADNAGGIAEMSKLDPKVRERTDALDSLGNTTAATGKGFAIGSAALTALALLAAYREEAFRFLGAESVSSLNLTLLNPQVIVGLLIGGMLTLVFCALTMMAVGRAGGMIVVEVRRQFQEIPGLLEGTGKPDYARCVNLCTKEAQKEMIFPSLLAICSPVIMGLLLGVEGVLALLAGTLATGFVMALFMANAGGAWDNAKKYIEKGALGGKGSPAHKAGVVGDTVGDPFKDTSGPALNILIKLMNMVSIVCASFVVSNSLF